jgi:hypothetical protein
MDSTLETWLWALFLAAVVLTAGLTVSWVRGAGVLHRLGSGYRFTSSIAAPARPTTVVSSLEVQPTTVHVRTATRSSGQMRWNIWR